MAERETLFERLQRARESQPPESFGDDRGVLTRSITKNLQRILAARQGHAPAQMDYGIPAPSEVANLCGDGIETMKALVKACVEKYEPRITEVSVLHLEIEDNPMALMFSIRGRLASLPDRPMVSFDTVVEQTGRMIVNS